MGTLYENILALCDSRGIKGGKMCTDLGISKGLLTDLKMGRRTGVSAATAQKIAAYFGVTVGQLLGHQETGVDVLEQVDIAFYGDFKELDESEKEAVRDMVRIMRQRRAAKQRE